MPWDRSLRVVVCSLVASACSSGGASDGEGPGPGPTSASAATETAATSGGETGAPTGADATTSTTGALPTTSPTSTTSMTSATSTSVTSSTGADTETETTGPIGPIDYPDQRVGMFYLGWHAFAYDAVIKTPGPRTVEAVVRGGLQFNDMLADHGLFNEAYAFHWHQEPSLGFYSLYRPRPGEPPIAEPNAAAAFPDTTTITTPHAQMLWDAGVDFIYMDLTNIPAQGDFADVLGIRPLEVLLEDWGALRAQGTPTPQVAAWVPASAVDGAEPTFRKVLSAYAAAYPDLILTHAGQPVLFLVDHGGLPIDPTFHAEIVGAGVLPVPLWGNLDAGKLASGTAAWMQPCASDGKWETIFDGATVCNQGYTTTSPLGTVVSVSRSFQVSYASLPFTAPGRLGGLTFQKQFATALAVQPDYLLINAWNEHIAQPQPNPAPEGLGALRKSMGMGHVPDGEVGAEWLWVDVYGAEYSRDFEPTVEDGGAGLALLASCLRVWRTGATSCADANEPCCQAPEERALIRSLRTGGVTSLHVPTSDANEIATLLAQGPWKEVCSLHYDPTPLCAGGTTGDGPFRLYKTDGPGRVPIHRCYAGDNFLTTDPNCEGQMPVALLGYAAAGPTTDSARPLTRCLTAENLHLHWLDGPCPPGTTGEAVLGWVR